MKFNRVLFFIFAALVTTLLTACGPIPSTNWPGMITDGNNVYLADGHFVYTVQVSNGQELTARSADGTTTVPVRFPAAADGNISIYGAPALTADGQLVFGNASTLTNVFTLYSTDAATAALKWSFLGAKSTWMAGAKVSTTGDTIYAANSDGKLYAFDLKGQKLWESPVSTDALWSSPVTDGKNVYVGTLSHDLVALDPATGKQRWIQKLDNAIIGAPAISADGTLYIGTLSGNLYAFNATEGSQIWMTKLQGGIWATPALDGETLYIGTSDHKTGKLYIINAADGKIIRALDETGSVIGGALVLKDMVVYVTEDGFLNFIDKKGDDSVPPIKVAENAKLYTTPILAGDFILVAPTNAEFVLAAYNQKGIQQWKFVPAR